MNGAAGGGGQGEEAEGDSPTAAQAACLTALAFPLATAFFQAHLPPFQYISLKKKKKQIRSNESNEYSKVAGL